MPFMQDERVAAQVIVYICAYLLAMIQVVVFQTIFNFATRLSIALKGLNLQQITSLHAINRGDVAWKLPFVWMVVTLIMSIALIAPGVFWTGSLTPILYHGLQVPGEVEVPAFTSNSKDLSGFEFQESSKTAIRSIIVNISKTIES